MQILSSQIFGELSFYHLSDTNTMTELAKLLCAQMMKIAPCHLTKRSQSNRALSVDLPKESDRL